MLKKQTSQSGSTIGIITILILTVLLVGALGYTWWQNRATIKPLANTLYSDTQKEATPTRNKVATASNGKSQLVTEEREV